jgi:shikimate kinase
VSSDRKYSLIVLTGFMGAGKSSVGRALASLLSWSFIDLDCEIEREQGRRIREIFAAEGEPGFREIEVAGLRSVVASGPRPMVLATGGGTFVQAQNAGMLRAAQATVVFLEASAGTLLQRCCPEGGESGEAIRPLAHDREAFIRLYEQRLPLYRTADLTVSSENKQPEAVAREIAERLRLER